MKLGHIYMTIDLHSCPHADAFIAIISYPSRSTLLHLFFFGFTFISIATKSLYWQSETWVDYSYAHLLF